MGPGFVRVASSAVPRWGVPHARRHGVGEARVAAGETVFLLRGGAQLCLDMGAAELERCCEDGDFPVLGSRAYTVFIKYHSIRLH